MKSTSSQPSQRMLRVAEQIKEVIAQTLSRGHFHNPVLMDTGVTVTEVRVSPDLKHATAYVISLGGKNMDEVLPALNDEAHGFQKEINRQTQLKFTPKLQFRIDDTFDTVTRLEGIMHNIKYSDQE